MAQARQRDAGEMGENKQRQAVRDHGMQLLRARRAPQSVGGQRQPAPVAAMTISSATIVAPPAGLWPTNRASEPRAIAPR